MPFWFLEDLRRFRVEKSAIEQLGGRAEWLVGFVWGIDGEGLYLDATICAHGYNYEVRMRYPTHFPYVPPAVHPSNAEERWSAHQYVNGTLCLEWGPDTWHPGITGAQVLQSAYTLLEIENPRGSYQGDGIDVESGRAESRHSLTLGQRMRNTAHRRFYVGSAIQSHLLGLPDASDTLHFLVLWDTGGNDLDHLAPLPVATVAPASRIPLNLKGLSERTVAIVGVGSAGSKIAVSLARMGVARFLLIDEDIFLPENICRHDLDWLNIGEHKVDALAQRLEMIAADIIVDTSKLNLTGQESPSALNALTTKLVNYDLIIDATANAEVFSLLTGVAALHKRPLLWLEVYAGGIGGMIARSRPGLDPDAHTMRCIYARYTTEHPFSDAIADSQDARDYQLKDLRGSAFAASDAYVSGMTSPCARLAGDTLVERDPSQFPYSMYLIGLEQAWGFEAPFSTIPIATAHLLDAIVRQEGDVALLAATTSFLACLIGHAEKAQDTHGQA